MKNRDGRLLRWTWLALPAALMLLAGCGSSPAEKDYNAARAEREAQKAVERYRAVAEKHPDTEWARRSLMRVATLYELELRDYEKAVAAYDDYLKKYPESEWTQKARYNLACCYRRRAQVRLAKTEGKVSDEAREDLNKAITQFRAVVKGSEAPGREDLGPLASHNIANIYLQELWDDKNAKDEAMKELESLTACFPSYPLLKEAEFALINLRNLRTIEGERAFKDMMDKQPDEKDKDPSKPDDTSPAPDQKDAKPAGEQPAKVEPAPETEGG